MKIAILSDIHDHIWNLRAALSTIQDADALICCGDLCSPFIVPMLAEGFPRPIHVVFGNNDGDLFRMTRNTIRFPHFQTHGELFEAELDGRKFSVNHYDNIGLKLASGGQYDVVCFGHNHRYQVEHVGDTLVINPGTIMGYNPIDRREVPPTFVIYDTRLGRTEGYQVLTPTGRSDELVVARYGSA
jgi:uncharacterized protein